MARNHRDLFFEIHPKGDMDFAEKIHEWTLVQDPFLAGQARALKEIYPAVMAWMRKESEKGTPPEEVLDLGGTIVANILIMVAESLATKPNKIQVAEYIWYQASQTLALWAGKETEKASLRDAPRTFDDRH
jgi:hypothetical protein